MKAQIKVLLMQAQFYLEWVKNWWMHLSIEQQIGYILLSLACLIAAQLCLFILKNVLVWLLQQFGLSTPVLYSRMPRLPWRLPLKVYLSVKRWYEFVIKLGKGSTGGFSSSLSVQTHLYKPSQVLLGRAYFLGFGLMQSVGIKIARHIMVYAMTGAGKTTWLIAMLSVWRGSAWIIDPKGQVFDALASHDKREWIGLFPDEPERTAKWNPFDDIKFAMERNGLRAGVKWSKRLARALVVTPPKSNSPYFSDTARKFVSSLVLFIISSYPEEQHNLGTLFELACFGVRVYNDDGSLESSQEESYALLLKLMLESTAFGNDIAAGAAAMCSSSGKTSGDVLSTLQEQLSWLSDESVRYMLSGTTRPISDAKTRDDVVFALVAPVLSLKEELKPLARLWTNFTIYTFEAIKKSKGLCLTIVDETQSIGANPTLQAALAFVRSYKQVMVIISQDREGMKAEFKSVDAFTGNADAVLWMATNHPNNIEYLNKTLGKRTITQKDKRTGHKTYREVDVMTEEQIGRFLSPDSGNMIVTRAGGRAMRLKISKYFNELPVWAYAPDPDHKEPILRRIARFVLMPFIRVSKPKPQENADDTAK